MKKRCFFNVRLKLITAETCYCVFCFVIFLVFKKVAKNSDVYLTICE